MNYFAIVFDLDGTLLNTLEDLANSMNAVLGSMGFERHPISDYRYFVGEGIAMLARRALPEAHRTEAAIAACVNAMREAYNARCMQSTAVYPGIIDMLAACARKALKTAVLSNKPDEMTKKLVSHYFPGHVFDCVNGARESVPRKPDPAGAMEIAGLFNLEPASILYLGDSKTDMETATAAGMYPVGALWGFRDERELWQYGAKKVIAKPGELLGLI